MTLKHDELTVEWFGYATVRLETEDGFVAYIDPGRYGVLTGDWEPDTLGVGHPEPVDYRAEDGDVVFVTHNHHYDSDGIERVASDDATVVVYDGVNTEEIDRDVKAVDDLPYEIRRIGEEDHLTVGDCEAWSLPAYNEPNGPHTRGNGEPFHPKGFGVGFLLSLGGTTVFWPGDSDVLAGHRELEVSLFLPPIGGSFTMDRRESAELAEALSPDLVVPIHYNTFSALETDSEAFAEDVESRGVSVALDEE
ncbi:L-ascorbate metabolism protein UlaG, beta-lactamase superfamily [Haladaptatus litoreus]|uniref:L-ascorbate metabolism protein UlaG, beta-lactamase superfamily n=1 Tax=Haladaptatus litoreus TaxID=553468 RepID=A0A1N6YN44_9EURY|nr:MBL fold metallo-hydrolase [Haladaptatus litoreus]SIR16033.1 L-ascorbate metabolism protein UlaG, beta-lactamase superfamily [Haladaptatus litoreus]